MKKIRFSHCQWGLILVISTSMSLAGCRTGGAWKMPGSSLFSASRTPDAATLAGTNGVSRDVPQLPESPAAKYSPDSIASVGTRSSSPSDSKASQKATSAYGFPAQTVATPTTGLAASANGYQTGPYPVGGVNAPSSATPSTQGTAGASAYPNPYGGTYSGNTTAEVGLPNSVKSAMAGVASGMPSYQSVNGTSTPSYNGTGGYGPQPTTTMPGQSPTSTPAPNSAYPAYPTAGNSPLANIGGAATSTNPSIGPQNTLANYPTNSAALPAYPTIPEIGGSVGQLSPASSAYQGATSPSGGYTPGTTARPTSYDFSPKSASGTPTAGTTGTLPPNTATLPSYPSYPSSSLMR